MSDLAALSAAIALHHRPDLSRIARRSALPRGLTFLLEIAAGDPDALAIAARETRRTEAELRRIAGFYIEQVLFVRDAESYRLLGCNRNATSAELRRHMALLMRWLHPDVTPRTPADTTIDRSVFATRIAKAWEDLKSDDRRRAYDATLTKEATLRPRRRNAPTADHDRAKSNKPSAASPRPPGTRKNLPFSKASAASRLFARFFAILGRPR
ncbi:MAG: DnaJ domain-containing protein [Hyphomicrobium sp.]|nr:DnaJ domain-containing protein [Hyphomicrobium sp.]